MKSGLTIQELAADDRAFLLKIRDTVLTAVNEANFSRVVEMMRKRQTQKMNTANVPEVVRLASRDFGITDEEHPGVLQHLIEGQGPDALRACPNAGYTVQPGCGKL